MKTTLKSSLLTIVLLALLSNQSLAQNPGPFVTWHDLVPPQAELTFYGRKVAIDRDVVLIGSHAGNSVQVVDFTSGETTWSFENQFPQNNTIWGYAVSIFENDIVIGDLGNLGGFTQGLAALLEVNLNVLDSNVGSTNQDPLVGDILLIDDPTVNLPLLGQLEFNSEFGHDVARSNNLTLVGEPLQSTRLGVLVPMAGRAHVYYDDIPITSYQNPNADAGDAFGAYVAIEEFGSQVFIAISAHKNDTSPGDDAGRVYLYELNSGNQPIHVFSKDGSVEFGQDVDIDNGRLLVKYDGGAELYDLASPGFPNVAEFSHDEPANPPIIFSSQTCEISGDRVVLGVPGTAFDGRIYAFDARSPEAPNQVIEDPTVSAHQGSITNPPISFQDAESWPTSIALWGGRIVAGSPLHSEAAFYQGQTNLFYVPGDANHDGFVSTDDINPFVAILVGQQYLLEADINNDGAVTGEDAYLLVDLIQNQN